MAHEICREEEKRQREEKKKWLELHPKKDKSIEIPRLYEFQFFDDFEGTVALAERIKQKINNYEQVTEQEKAQFEAMVNTGFTDWSREDYQSFLSAFKQNEIDDVEGMAAEIESKTAEDVERYLTTFLQRFGELKERDLILMKFQKKDFEQQNLQTILEFSKERAARGEYTVFLQ